MTASSRPSPSRGRLLAWGGFALALVLAPLLLSSSLG
jgi:hypothetical protein